MKKIFALFMLMLLMAGFSAKAQNEIYAVLDPSIHCLTLYYDDQRESRGGVTEWGLSEYMREVTWFDLDISMKNARPTSTQYWFGGYGNVTSIRHLEYLNTSEVIDMEGMFLLCSALTTLDLRSFDITNVTNLSSMFYECTNLTTIYCKGNWSATTANSYGMFEGCMALVGGNGTTYDPNHIDASYARLDQPGQQGYFTDKGPEVYALYDDATTTMTLHYDNMCLENGGSTEWWNEFPKADITIVILDESMQEARPERITSWFKNFHSLTEIQHLDYLNTSEVTDMSIMFYDCFALTQLDLSNFNTSNVTDMSYMFWECSSLTQLDLGSFNTSNVTDMSYMFAHCYKLKTIELRSFDISNVTSLAGMFFWCSKLNNIHCNANWSTTTAETGDMFGHCEKLPNYDAEKTNAEYARPYKDGQKGYFTEREPFYALYDAETTTMTIYHGIGITTDWWNDLPSQDITTAVLDESMQNARPKSTALWFATCHNLTEIQHLDYLNTSEVTDMSQMFYYCYALTSVDLRSFDVTNVTDMRGMFEECQALKTVYCGGNWSTTTANSERMFEGCMALVGGNGTTYDRNHTDASYARLDEPGTPGYFALEEFVPEEIYAVYDASSTTMTLYYDEKREENNGSTEWWNDLPSQDITTAVLDESMQNARPKSTALWFATCNNLTEIQHLDYLNTSEVTDMSRMFYYCYALTSVDLRSFDVTNVTDMRGMFEECQALKTIYCGGNWSATTADSQNMFEGCMALVGGNGTTYDPNHTDASYARLDEPGTPGYFALDVAPEIYAIYEDATGILTLYFNKQREEQGGIPQERWNELPNEEVLTVVLDESMKNARPRSTSGWFYYFTRLREIQHLEYLNTSEVTDMSIMFRNCERLTTLDLRSFDITKVTNMRLMFYDCAALKTIYCNDDWSTTTADTEDMFTGCTSIVGGNGTTYDRNHIDASYARYDEPGAPGYFTINKTGIEQIVDGRESKVESRKILYNGELYILRGDRTFTATGAEVR